MALLHSPPVQWEEKKTKKKRKPKRLRATNFCRRHPSHGGLLSKHQMLTASLRIIVLHFAANFRENWLFFSPVSSALKGGDVNHMAVCESPLVPPPPTTTTNPPPPPTLHDHHTHTPLPVSGQRLWCCCCIIYCRRFEEFEGSFNTKRI